MAKFCKIFENEKGNQLLLLVVPSQEETDLSDVEHHFEVDGACVKITLGGLDWDKSQSYLDEYPQEKAENILKDPMGFINSLTS